MRSLACALVLVVACSKPGGVVFDVQAPDGVDTVRVFIGISQVSGVNGLTVPDATGAVSHTTTQNVFARDPDNESDVHAYRGGTLSFEFQNGDQTSLPAAIVVGYGQGAPVAAAVLTDIALQDGIVDRYPVSLEPLDANTHLFLWSAAQGAAVGDAACAGVSGGGNAAFIVTNGDTDCDSFPDTSPLECNPFFWHDTMATASLQNGMCIGPGSDTADEADCKLGANACMDGVGPVSGTCTTHNTVCVPTAACGNCAGTGSDTPLDCIIGSATDGDDFAYSCALAAPDPTCAITLPRPPTGGWGCRPPGNANSQTGVAIKGDGVFDDKVTIDNVTYQLAVTDSCEVSLQPTASAMTTGDTAILLRLDLTNGNSLILPIDVTFGGSAGSGPQCSSCVGLASISQPPLTGCVAGWTPVGATQIAGHSPSLDKTETEMFFITDDDGSNAAIEMATRDGSAALTAWSMPEPVVVTPPILAPVYLHIDRDGTTMWVVDGAFDVIELTRDLSTAANVFTWGGVPIVTNMPGGVNAFSPDATGTDAVLSIGNSEMFEAKALTSAAWQAALANAVAFGAGQTPFLSDDDFTVWYSGAGAGGKASVFVASRADGSDAFNAGSDVDTPPVQLDELGSSTLPMEPWVSADQTTMFYSSDANGTRMIYAATRF